MDIDGTPRSGPVKDAVVTAAEEVAAVEDNTVEDRLEHIEPEKEDSLVAEPAGCAAFCKEIFKTATAPLLPRPVTSPRRGGRGRGRKRVMVSTRSSMRLAARPSPIPVAQRAQRKLMRELQFIDDTTTPQDAAVTEYVDLYGQDLPQQAIDAIRAATRAGNKHLCKVLAAIAEEAGAADLEMP